MYICIIQIHSMICYCIVAALIVITKTWLSSQRGVVDLDIPRIKAICDIAWQEDLAVVRMTDCGELLHQLADVLSRYNPVI